MTLHVANKLQSRRLIVSIMLLRADRNTPARITNHSQKINVERYVIVSLCLTTTGIYLHGSSKILQNTEGKQQDKSNIFL